MQVHVMLVGTDDGSLHVSICDSFTVGTFPPSAMVSSTSTPAAPRLLSLHASHPDASTHALLLRSASDPTSAYLAPMDLPFVASSPANLALMASRLTTLQKLLRYLVQAQLHMQLEYKNTRELPVRFLRGIQEDLAARATRGGARGIVQALYHTAVTGHLGKVVKEWLVDSVSERVGHPRVPSCRCASQSDALSLSLAGPQTLGQGRQVRAREPSRPRA
jgi:anaphase-promoting complex subunit 4